jgi:hypothetical protein
MLSQGNSCCLILACLACAGVRTGLLGAMLPAAEMSTTLLPTGDSKNQSTTIYKKL